jgi:hypothetical protein
MGTSIINSSMPSMTIQNEKDHRLRQQESDFKLAVKLQLKEIANVGIDLNKFKIDQNKCGEFNKENGFLNKHFGVQNIESEDILAIIIARSISNFISKPKPTFSTTPNSEIPKVKLELEPIKEKLNLEPVKDEVSDIHDSLDKYYSSRHVNSPNPISTLSPSSITPEESLGFSMHLENTTNRWLTCDDIKRKLQKNNEQRKLQGKPLLPEITPIGANLGSHDYIFSVLKERQLMLIKQNQSRVSESSSKSDKKYLDAYERLFNNSSSSGENTRINYLSGQQNSLESYYSTDMHLFINTGANQRLDSSGIPIQDGTHWVYAMVRFDETNPLKYTVYYKDSFGNPPDAKLFKIEGQDTPSIHYDDSKQQTDGVNCGMWALQNFRQVVDDKNKNLSCLFPHTLP